MEKLNSLVSIIKDKQRQEIENTFPNTGIEIVQERIEELSETGLKVIEFVGTAALEGSAEMTDIEIEINHPKKLEKMRNFVENRIKANIRREKQLGDEKELIIDIFERAVSIGRDTTDRVAIDGIVDYARTRRLNPTNT